MRRTTARGTKAALGAVTLALVGIGATACGVPIAASPTVLPANQVPPALSVAPATTLPPSVNPSGKVLKVTIFLVNGLQEIVPNTRYIPWPSKDPVQAVLDALAQGPNGPEAHFGYSSDLPSGVQLSALGVHAGVEGVGLSASFLSQGGEDAIGEYAQVVNTLAAVPDAGIKALKFYSDGQPYGAVLPTGQFVTRAVTASDYSSLLAPS